MWHFATSDFAVLNTAGFILLKKNRPFNVHIASGQPGPSLPGTSLPAAAEKCGLVPSMPVVLLSSGEEALASERKVNLRLEKFANENVASASPAPRQRQGDFRN